MHRDHYIRFDYDPQINKFAFRLNDIGAQEAEVLQAAPAEVTEANRIIVATNGSDTTGSGTIAAPYRTIEKGINETDEDHPYVTASGELFAESLSGVITDYLQGVYALTGSPKLTRRAPDGTPGNDNRIFFGKSGSDVTGSGTIESPVASIGKAKTLTTSTKQICRCLDSETYEEDAFSFAGNFKGIEAAEGETPTLILKPSIPNQDYAYDTVIKDLALDTGWSNELATVQLGNGNYATARLERGSAGSGTVVYYIHKKDTLDQVKGRTTVPGIANQPNGPLSIGKISDGHFAIGWRWDNAGGDPSAGQFAIFKNDGTHVMTISISLYWASINKFLQISDDKFVVVGDYVNGSNYVQFHAIYKTDGTTVVSPTNLRDISWYTTCTLLENGNIAVIYADIDSTTATYYGISGYIIDQDGNVIQGDTKITTTAANYHLDAVTLSDGNIGVSFSAYIHPTGYAYRMVLSPTLGKIDETLITTGSLISYRATISSFAHGEFIVFLSDRDNATTSYIKAENDGTPTLGLTSILPNHQIRLAALATDENIIAGGFAWGSGATPKIYIIHAYGYNGIAVDVDASITGFKIDGNQNHMVRFAKLNSAKLTLRNVTIEDCINPAGLLETDDYVIEGTGDLDIRESSLVDGHLGIKVISDNVTIRDTEIARMTQGYALHVDGAGAGIVLDHLDVFNNYNGIRLENNDGNEIIKNIIARANSNYGVNAETAVAVTYSVVPDAILGATLGTGSLTNNPQYINEGFVDPDDIDLNIKIRLIGYQVDSPAYLRADDNRNAGAHDVRYIGSLTTWKSITIRKPLEIDTYVDFTGTSGGPRSDGSVSSSFEGMTLYWRYKYGGMINSDFANLVKMLTCSNSSVRMFLEPITFPDEFELVTKLYDRINKGAKHYRLTRTGVQGVEFGFARAYEAEA